MGLTKGLKQIAADFISLLGKDKAHRGSKRDGRLTSDMRSTKGHRARYSAGASSSSFPSSPPHSSHTSTPDMPPEFAFFRDALSDDGTRGTSAQPPQHLSSAQQKEDHLSSTISSVLISHGTIRCASQAAASASTSQPSASASSFPCASATSISARAPTYVSPLIETSELSQRANTAPIPMAVASIPTSAASDDPQLPHTLPAATASQAALAVPAPVSISVHASCKVANASAIVAAVAAAPTGASAGAVGCPAATQRCAALPTLPPVAATCAAGAVQSAPAAATEEPEELPVCLEMAPSSPLPVQRTCGQGSPAPSAAAAGQSQQRHSDAATPAVERSGASLDCSAAAARLASRPMPPAGLLYTSPSLSAAMRRTRQIWSVEDFEIGKKIHKGYSSSVYKASCLYSGTDVILKAYNLAGLSTFLRNQVLRELDIHSRLRHPGVVHLMAAFREDNNLLLLQEYVRGGSLDRVRRKLGGRMTEFQAMHLVLLPLLGVLSYLHERGIVHRDIKPDNLLFTDNWKLKVCDFGVSICLHDERAVTRTGTREYLAPEVDRCPPKRLPQDNKTNTDLAYTSAVDVWSLGSLMYELLVGFTPFPGGPPARKEGASGSAGAALAFPGGISREARAFIRDCLELDPADRPTVQQLQEHAWVQEALIAAEALITPASK
ncbi:hypothetical protein PLESTF_000710100 [Pleodorina starrii]|nr:hypothetical protein PLESTM_001799300 [Pleodorina starrii]GLC68573.1 hypothetical protein PLESTF_000710100 [Pleodorina starrii]